MRLFESCALLLVPHTLRTCVYCVSEMILQCRSFVEDGKIQHIGAWIRLVEHAKDIPDRSYEGEECKVENERTETDILGHRRFIFF